MAQQGAKATATTQPGLLTRTQPEQPKPRPLPMFRVILHNDDKNEFDHVLATIVMLTPLNKDAATQRMMEAHDTGCSLLLVTHKERAELYAEQFQSRSLVVSIEPTE